MTHKRLNKVTLSLIVFLLTFISSVIGQNKNVEIDIAEIVKTADSLAEHALMTKLSPGITIGIGVNGEIQFAKGYGYSNIEDGVLTSKETVYGISSVTKQFTAVTILKLMEEGKISLDDSVGKFLPEFPLQGNHVTIRHLLNHTSGISPMQSTSSIKDKNWFSKDLSYEEMINYFGNEPFEFKPGEKHVYNNFAYYLLGEIITRVTNIPWELYMEKELFAPLGLNATTICDTSKLPQLGATSYLKGGESFMKAPKMSWKVLGAAGALCSTVEDLIKWNNLLFNGKVISQSSLNLMLAPTTLTSGAIVNEGFGLYMDQIGEYNRIYHGGTLPWGAFLSYYPDTGISIAVLTNSARVGREVAEVIEKKLAIKALGVQSKNVLLDDEQLKGYTGIYILKLGEQEREMRIFQDQENLMGQLQGQNPQLLRYQGDHLFSLEADPNIKLSFTMDGGKARKVVLHQRGMEMPGDRKVE